MPLLRRRARGCGTSSMRWTALLFTPLLLTACDRAVEEAAPAPPEVNVVRAVADRIPLDLHYTARVRGEREVEVRARVSGILEKRFYAEGSAVRKGDLLFRIDPQPFAAAVRAATARLGVAEAQITEREQQARRIEALNARGLASLREQELAQSALASAQATVAAARAELEAARLELAWTEVRAPVAGITGLETRSEGSLVNAQDASSLLTTLSQTQRLYVDFTMPEREARRVRAALAADADAIRVRLRPHNGTDLAEPARIDFLDARVDADSGTVAVRATLDNADQHLFPGQFVRATLAGLNSERGIHIPARAVLYGADQPFVWTVDGDGIVQFTPVRLSPARGNLVRVDDGLAEGDRVIVDGVLKVGPGAPAQAVEIDLDPSRTASGDTP